MQNRDKFAFIPVLHIGLFCMLSHYSHQPFIFIIKKIINIYQILELFIYLCNQLKTN